MIRYIIFLLACLATLPVSGQQDSIPGLPCPGGRLVPTGFAGRSYQFVSDSLRVSRNEEGAHQLLVQHYKEKDVSGTILHVYLSNGPTVKHHILDSLVRSHNPEARYAGQLPVGLFGRPDRIPCTLLRERKGKLDTLVTESLSPSGNKIVLASHLEGRSAAMFREAQVNYPKQRLLLSLWLPTVPGAPAREYIHDLTATMNIRPKTNDR